MTKQDYINVLREMDTEYLYRDYGYGAFNDAGEFIVQGRRVQLTLADVKAMYDAEMAPLLADAAREFGHEL